MPRWGVVVSVSVVVALVGCGKDNTPFSQEDLDKARGEGRTAGVRYVVGANPVFEPGISYAITFRDGQHGLQVAKRLKMRDDTFYNCPAYSGPCTTEPFEAVPTETETYCDPGYGGCIDPAALDYDCLGGSGDGPEYVEGPIEVYGDDPFGLDRDGNGVGCEA